MDDEQYSQLQNTLVLLGNLLPEVSDLQEMTDRISRLEAMEPMTYIMAPIPAMNIAPGYERMRALSGYASAIAKARKKFDEFKAVVGDTEPRIHRDPVPGGR
ncbi:MAG: hypothetical protein V3T08_09250 [Gemmatimonadota bacterium]